MPYIDKARRLAILEDMGVAHDSNGQVRPDARPVHRLLSPGELNFAITALMHEYILAHGKNYANLSAVAAQGKHAADEFYRTVIAPYENLKRAEHGCISPVDQFFGEIAVND